MAARKRKQIPSTLVTRRRKQRPDPRYPLHVREGVKRWKELTLKRGELGRQAYDHQDAETRAVLDRMRSRLVLGANGILRFRGKKGEGSFDIQVELEFIEHNAMFVATEILKDMALMDVRVANYKFPDVLCAECGTEIAKTPIPRRKGGRIK